MGLDFYSAGVLCFVTGFGKRSKVKRTLFNSDVLVNLFTAQWIRGTDG